MYILDCGLNGNLSKLDAGLIAYFVGYVKVANYITQNNLRVANNQCQSWIEKTYKKNKWKKYKIFYNSNSYGNIILANGFRPIMQNI